MSNDDPKKSKKLPTLDWLEKGSGKFSNDDYHLRTYVPKGPVDPPGTKPDPGTVIKPKKAE